MKQGKGKLGKLMKKGKGKVRKGKEGRMLKGVESLGVNIEDI